MAFVFRSFQQILVTMISRFLSSTGVNDINPGSVVTTFLEAGAQEDAEQYFQMFQIIAAYNLDTAEGDDLEDRAKEIFKLTGVNVGDDEVRLPAQKSTTIVTIGDSSITKVQTKLFAGNRGPVSGQAYVDVDNASAFPASGSIIVGRETGNAETLPYSSITNFDTYYRFNLTSNLTNDHGTEESAILSQGGVRNIPAGTLVKVPESDTSREISFTLVQAAAILDGDDEVSGVDVVSSQPGSESNVPPNTIIEFETEPFNGATVTNPESVTNGRDRESDIDLRDRIKDYVQSLSKGTKKAIVSGVIGLESVSQNNRVVSANAVETNSLTEREILYIDDGSGLEPTFETIGTETIIEESTGGEVRFQLQNFPVIKAEVESQGEQPFELYDGDDLTIEVNGVAETLIFNDSDFEIEGSATAIEVVAAINDRLSSIEARTSDDRTRVLVRAKTDTNENIRVTGGAANTELNFSTDEVFSLKLYRRDNAAIEDLSKDGSTAQVESGSAEPFGLSGGETLTVVVDGKTANTQTVTFQVGDFNSPGFALAEEVVERINAELAGAFALTTSNGTKVTIRSRQASSDESQIQITGGTANVDLDFSTAAVSGSESDYTLNRYNGQIELSTESTAGYIYEAGSLYTRAFITTGNEETYVLTNGDTITVSVDGAATQVATFNTADFADITNATAAEVAEVINADIDGCTAFATSDGGVTIRTNNWASTGSIEVTAVSGTATALGFSVGTEILNLKAHVANIQNADLGAFSFSEGDTLTVVMDKDSENNTYEIPMDIGGEISVGDASAPYTTFIALSEATSQNFNLRFTTDNDFAGYTVLWKTGDNATTTSVVTSYNASTGQFTLSATTTNSIDAGDTFRLIPTTAANVVTHINNRLVSSFPVRGAASLLRSGYIQLESLTSGTDSSVNVTGGDANAELLFSTTAVEGRDGYRYYTGLVQRVQHVVDGLDSDLDNFEGIRAMGVQIEVLPPVIRELTVTADVTLSTGVITATIRDEIIAAVSSYINGLGVGQDVVHSEIIDAVMDVTSVIDVEISIPSGNIAIADNEVPRVANNRIYVS